MAPNLSKRVRDALDESLRDNPQIDSHEITVLYGTIYSTVIKRRALVRRIELTGTDTRHKAGRPRIITPELLEYTITLIKHNATLYQDEVTDFIYMEFGIQLDQPQVSRLLKQAGISHKKLSIQAY